MFPCPPRPQREGRPCPNMTQHWCETPLASVICPFTHAKGKPYIFLQFKEGGEERLHRTHIFQRETPGNTALSYFLQWTCNTRWHLFFSSWVAFTFLCAIHSKGSGHTRADSELEVKPWSKVHGSRSSPISRPFTKRCEKGAGCVPKG